MNRLPNHRTASVPGQNGTGARRDYVGDGEKREKSLAAMR